MNESNDDYDDAIEYLTKNPDDILAAWQFPYSHPGGCLFKNTHRGDMRPCGCLTQIRDGDRAPTIALTVAIRSDERIPQYPDDIRVENLPVFKEWQERIDHMYAGGEFA